MSFPTSPRTKAGIEPIFDLLCSQAHWSHLLPSLDIPARTYLALTQCLHLPAPIESEKSKVAASRQTAVQLLQQMFPKLKIVESQTMENKQTSGTRALICKNIRLVILSSCKSASKSRWKLLGTVLQVRGAFSTSFCAVSPTLQTTTQSICCRAVCVWLLFVRTRAEYATHMEDHHHGSSW